MTTLATPTPTFPGGVCALLVALRDRDVRVAIKGDQLSLVAPQGALTTELLARLKKHKPAILALMSGGCDLDAWCLWQLALDRVEAAGQLPDDVLAACRRAKVVWNKADSHEAVVAEPDGPRCARCGSTDRRDVPIHGGRSARSDCARCGHFIGFARWNPPPD